MVLAPPFRRGSDVAGSVSWFFPEVCVAVAKSACSGLRSATSPSKAARLRDRLAGPVKVVDRPGVIGHRGTREASRFGGDVLLGDWPSR
jgi:hypothetical protein